MSLQNRQKYESIIDYENQSIQQNDSRKTQTKLIGLNKYIIIGIVAISITFFVIFAMNKETQDEINKKKMKQLYEQYKGFNKGPQISSRQYRDKKNKSQNENGQDNKENKPFLGDDDNHKNDEQKQDGAENNDNQNKINQEEKKQQHDEKKGEHSNEKSQDESESEEINLQEDTKKNKTDLTKKKEDQEKPQETQNEKPNLQEDKEEKKESQKPDQEEMTDYRPENKVFFCSEAQFLFKLSCLDSCPVGFKPDNYDRVCKHKEINPVQIELKYYDKQDESISNSEIQNKKQNFYQVIKSLEYTNKDQVDYGFFFFNQIDNDGFNFLNSHFSGSVLNNFLNNTDSIIVALGGEESYYLENEIEIKDIVTKTIQENPQIKKWYAIGIYDVGSYGALVNLNKLIGQLDGAIVLNPNYMNMQDNFNKKVDFSKFKDSNILGVAQQNQEIFKSKDMLLIEDKNSIYFQHTINYCSFTKCNIIKYDNSKYKNPDEKIENLLLAYIEQFISKKKSTYIENL